MGVTTSLNHDRNGKACYDSERNQRGHAMRSRKLAALQQDASTRPRCTGSGHGDLLLVGWGSTRGAIEEAVDRPGARASRSLRSTSSSSVRLPPGLKEIFSRFGRVITVELNYSDDWDDPLITEENRRYGQFAWLLRAATLVDIDCYRPGAGTTFHAGGDLRRNRAVLGSHGIEPIGIHPTPQPREHSR